MYFQILYHIFPQNEINHFLSLYINCILHPRFIYFHAVKYLLAFRMRFCNVSFKTRRWKRCFVTVWTFEGLTSFPLADTKLVSPTLFLLQENLCQENWKYILWSTSTINDIDMWTLRVKDSFLNLHIIDGFFRHVQHICQKLPILKTQIEYQVEDKLSRGNS